MTIKVALFDIGGVVISSPLTGIAKYEREQGLPHHYINALITAIGNKGAFHQFEMGKIRFQPFLKQWQTELNNVEFANESYKKYCTRTNKTVPNLPTSLNINSKDLFRSMGESTLHTNPLMENAIKTIRASGKYKVAALTNNFPKSPIEERDPVEDLLQKDDQLSELFDYYFQSIKLGIRKPNPEVYKLVCREMGVKPEEVVFLDDIGLNVKAARALGMTTIRVLPDTNVEPAIRELSQVLGLDLLPKSKL